MAHGESFDTLSDGALKIATSSFAGMQIFTDGGYSRGVGGAAVAFFGVFSKGGAWKLSLLGVRGVLMQSAESAFHAEVTALDLALEAVCCSLECSPPPKRVRRPVA